jgi:undecaprenyl-diphosphatase
MTEILIAIVLGIVEGFTEMLPISSTGHLILVNQWLSFGESFTKLFDIVIQMGAILAVLTFFWKEVSPFRPKSELSKVFRLWTLLAIGVFPILLIGYLLGGDILDILFTPMVVAVALIVNGILLILVDRSAPKDGPARELGTLRVSEALFIGLTHILGLIPGMSRSASATIGGMAIGVERSLASRFSMLMAIPTLTIASGYSLLKFEGVITAHDWGLLAIGFLVSWAVCYMTVAWFFRYIKKYGLVHFGYYRIVLGILVIVFLQSWS